MTNEQFRQFLGNTLNKLQSKLADKNSNYGCNAFEIPMLVPYLTPKEGIEVRIGDKISRLIALNSGEKDRVNEPKRETIEDLVGYGLLWLIADQLEHQSEV